jgi:putative ABC transport system ATP-binding protein
VTDPDIILADEPTGNLDTRASIEVMAILERLGEIGKTIVLVTHESDIAAHAARIITLRDGRVATDDPVPERRVAATELARLDSEVAA